MAQVFVYGALKKGAKDSAMAYTQRRARTLEGMLLAAGLPRPIPCPSDGQRTQARARERPAPVAAQPPHRGALPPGRETAPPARARGATGRSSAEPMEAPLSRAKRGPPRSAKVPSGTLRADIVFASGARTVLRRLRHPDGLSPRAVVLRGQGVPVKGSLRRAAADRWWAVD